MSQPTFAEAEYAGKKHKARQEKLLEWMDQLIPWENLKGSWLSSMQTSRLSASHMHAESCNALVDQTSARLTRSGNVPGKKVR
jgi:hypothetical protein